MFGVPLFGGPGPARSRVASRAVIGASLLFVAGCATTAGSASAVASAAGEYRFASPVAARVRTDVAIGLAGPVLERRAYVRAVLERNPTVESARQGFRAALSRVRQSGAFEDPMLDLAVAPLSIGSSKAALGYEVGISQRLP